MKKLFTLLMFLSIATTRLCAQNEKANSLGIEIDPIAYILKGYSIHGVYQPIGKWSFDAGIFGIEEPEFYLDNNRFTVSHKGFGAKVHYHLRENTKGFYVGLGSDYARTKAVLKENKAAASGDAWNAGFHAGYRFFMFKNNGGKGLYLTPWVSLNYQLLSDKLNFEQADFKQNKLSVFPTVHVGYRF